MATRIGSGRIGVTLFNSPNPKTPCWTQRSPSLTLPPQAPATSVIVCTITWTLSKPLSYYLCYEFCTMCFVLCLLIYMFIFFTSYWTLYCTMKCFCTIVRLSHSLLNATWL